MWLGAGKGRKNIVMVTLGTGVGGGIIIDGKPLVGAHGAGGEIGHLCVNYEETDHCGCGNTGMSGAICISHRNYQTGEYPSCQR